MNKKLLVALCLASGLMLGGNLASAEDEKPYTITDGKVDTNTYLGWKVFNTTCYSCHGVDATGTDVAPNLIDSINEKNMSKNEVITKILTRYRITVSADEVADPTTRRQIMMEEVLKYERAQQGELIMPSWSQNQDIRPHVEDLYAYLKARADGALCAGEPQKKGL